MSNTKKVASSSTQNRVKKNTTKKKVKRSVNKKNILTIIVCLILAIGLIGGSCGLIVIANMLQDKPNMVVEDFFSQESSHIYDKDGNLIGDVGTQIRTNVTYDDLPESLIDALVSVEDSRFFEHNGFDVPRFAKAMLVDVINMNFKQGGSTVTMQLVKNTYFTDDDSGTGAAKSISRKVQEIALATDLEKDTNKQAIIELYLNKLNFGGSGNIRGVQKAAQYYFGKNVNELNTSESAMLAGIINAPYSYNPFVYLDYATTRRNTVLNLMAQHGYITSAERDLAKSIKVEDLLVDPDSQTGEGGQGYEYQSYIDTVIEEAQTLTGKDPTTVAMEIYTYMDPKVQTTMDSIQAGNEESVVFPDELMECAMISMNNQTGEIVAIGGGRNYGKGGSMLLNHATTQYKQPGSSVKPILSYALAFEYLGWSTSHVVTDKPIVYAGTSHVIKNANNTYAGQVTLDYAVGNSLNTPAIQTLQEIVDTVPDGRAIVVDYLQRLGFTSVTNDNFDIGFAIGGSNFTTSTKELAAAHSIIMNGGNYITPHTISKIEFKNGDTPIEPTYTPDQVLSPQAAYLVSQLMYNVVNGPYYNYMQILKRNYPVYGKTGTTDWGTEGLEYNIPQGASKDKWMVSETSLYTTAVWVGYEKGVKDKNTYFDSAKSQLNIPGAISSLILSSLTDELNPPAVAQPEGISSITHILGTFPYAAPVENMDGAFLTTGLIKSDSPYISLVSPESSDIEQLGSFTASIGEDGALNMEWAPYPNPDQLQVAEDTMDLSLIVDGTTLVEAWGKRIFDYTWLFGPIRYKARVTQNGETIAEISSEAEFASEGVAMTPGNTITVCGFYQYENLGTESNELCTDLVAVDGPITITIPDTNASENDIRNWANAAGIQADFSYTSDASKEGTNLIVYNGGNANGSTISATQGTVGSIHVQVTIYTGGTPTEGIPTGGNSDCSKDNKGACNTTDACALAEGSWNADTNTCS